MWLQYLVVAVIVVAAALFAVWRLPGNATRRRYVAALRRLGGGRGPLHRLALALDSRLARSEGGCAGCSSAAEPGRVPGERRHS